jgi:uncharacterized protein
MWDLIKKIFGCLYPSTNRNKQIKITKNKELLMTLTKALWFAAGVFFLCVAFLGVYLPLLPWSTPSVIAAYCFARSSKKMHDWLYNHPLFGPFLTGWQTKRIFPTQAKYLMVVTMSSSLLIMWFTTGNLVAIAWTAGFMVLVCIWGWRYPGSEAEWQRRVDTGKKIAWLK